MKERLWVSNYDLNDVMGGAEILGRQFCKAMKLKYMSASKLGININRDKYDVAIDLDNFIARIPAEIVVYNTTNCWSRRPNADYTVGVCCEHFGHESTVLEGEPEFRETKLMEWDYQKAAMDNADKVIAISEQEKILFHKSGFGTTVIEPYIDLELFKPTNIKREKIALFVGRRHRRKGYDIFTELKKMFPEYRFVEVVDGNMSRDEMSELYNRSAFLLAPSRYESFGYTFAEALACDLPVIASRTGLFYTWQPREYGIFPKTIDTESFAQAIREYEVREVFSRSREEAKKRFSFERFRRECDEIVSDG